MLWATKEFEFKGLKELDRMLEQLPIKVQQKVMTGAVKAGVNIMKKEAKNQAPKKRRILEKSIIARKKKRSKPTELVFEMGPSKEAYWGLMQEIGFIATGPKKKGMTYSEFRGRAKATATGKGRKGATHVPGKHWLRKAFNLSYAKAMKKVKESLSKGIEKEAKKLSGTV